MHPLLDQYLCNKYPKIFVERKLSAQESAMWDGIACGNGWFHIIDALCSNIQNHIDNPQWLEINNIRTKLGNLWNRTVWNKILYPMLSKSLPYERFAKFRDGLMWNGPICRKPTESDKTTQVVACQVKEKFGGLRFYYDGGDEVTSAMIQFAESLSNRICEVCGKFNHIVGKNQRGWIRTTCPGCSQDSMNHVSRADDELKQIWAKIQKKKQK